jgi:hypothetical protein
VLNDNEYLHIANPMDESVTVAVELFRYPHENIMQFIKEDHLLILPVLEIYRTCSLNVKLVLPSSHQVLSRCKKTTDERASSIKLELFSTARLELATASLGIFRASLLDHMRNGSKTDIQKVVLSH